MNKRLSITLSLAIHLSIVVSIIILNPKIKIEKEEDIKINIELVTRKEEKKSGKAQIIDDNVDILDSGLSSMKESINKPTKINYLDLLEEPIPELYLARSDSEISNEVNSKNTSIENFENSLDELFSFDESILEKATGEDLSISWDGDTRDARTDTGIDFSKFPSESFTGVGVTVTFMVNPGGEVYSIKILPPGSGSVEFDIMIKQYVTNFLFKPGESNSKGELLIVYN